MPVATYALRLYRGGYPIQSDAGPLLVTLDLDDPAAVKRLLNLHLGGELYRQGIRADQWGDYEFRAFPVERGAESRTVAFRWALLAGEEGERR